MAEDKKPKQENMEEKTEEKEKKKEGKQAEQVSGTDTKRAEGAEVSKNSQPKAEQSTASPKGEKDKKKKPVKQEIKPKEKAVVNGNDLRISLKHCIAICKMIKGKSPEKAVEILEMVVKKKKPVPMPNREVAHQKGKGVAGGAFPEKASLEIIALVKQLNANAIISGVENQVITLAKANKASRPYKREGRRAKRTHVHLEVKDKTKLKKAGKEK